MSDINIDIKEQALEFDITATGPKGDPIDRTDYATKGTVADGDELVGFDSEDANAPKKWTFTTIFGAIKTWLQSNFSIGDNSDTTITSGAESDLLTLESGVWVNKAQINSLPKFAAGLNFEDIQDYHIPGEDVDPITETTSGATYTNLVGDGFQVSGGIIRPKSAGNISTIPISGYVSGDRMNIRVEINCNPETTTGSGWVFAVDEDNLIEVEIDYRAIKIKEKKGGSYTDLDVEIMPNFGGFRFRRMRTKLTIRMIIYDGVGTQSVIVNEEQTGAVAYSALDDTVFNSTTFTQMGIVSNITAARIKDYKITNYVGL